ncbi:transposase [uncultured Streptococcus sp.]|uniref:transposase n=1 Tax=uncultured Streptococcus sp. TaxID=83427 RepID=UPI0037DD9472
MIDERIRIQENYDMTMETAIDEAREEGLEQGLTQGVAQGRKQLVCEMISRGMTPELISDMTGLSIEEIETLLS